MVGWSKVRCRALWWRRETGGNDGSWFEAAEEPGVDGVEVVRRLLESAISAAGVSAPEETKVAAASLGDIRVGSRLSRA